MIDTITAAGCQHWGPVTEMQPRCSSGLQLDANTFLSQSCSNNIPSSDSNIALTILFPDTKIEDNSRAFKLQKANFDSEVNTAVGFTEKCSTFTVE